MRTASSRNQSCVPNRLADSKSTASAFGYGLELGAAQFLLDDSIPRPEGQPPSRTGSNQTDASGSWIGRTAISLLPKRRRCCIRSPRRDGTKKPTAVSSSAASLGLLGVC